MRFHGRRFCRPFGQSDVTSGFCLSRLFRRLQFVIHARMYNYIFRTVFYWSFIKWILRFGAVLALETNDSCHYVCVLVMSSCSRVNQCVQSTWSLKFHAQAIRGHISPKSHKVSDRMLCTTHPVTLYGRRGPPVLFVLHLCLFL